MVYFSGGGASVIVIFYWHKLFVLKGLIRFFYVTGEFSEITDSCLFNSEPEVSPLVFRRLESSFLRLSINVY